MQKMDYQPLAEANNMSRTARWAMIILLSIGSAPVIFFIGGIVEVLIRDKEFEGSTSESKLIGKTPNQITKLLGPPADQVVYSNSDSDIIYFGGVDSVARVEIRGGAATRVVHWKK